MLRPGSAASRAIIVSYWSGAQFMESLALTFPQSHLIEEVLDYCWQGAMRHGGLESFYFEVTLMKAGKTS